MARIPRLVRAGARRREARVEGEWVSDGVCAGKDWEGRWDEDVMGCGRKDGWDGCDGMGGT